MAKLKLGVWFLAATVATGIGFRANLIAEDMPPPPPSDDMMAPPPPDDGAAPPPPMDAAAPTGDAMAAPAPDVVAPPAGDAMAPPPPGDMAAPPAGDMMAPPPGDMAAPPAGDMMAPPPGDGTANQTLAPPPADTQFKEAAPAAAVAGGANSYSVMSGDSLWRISGKSSVYGDPFQWPLLFVNNRKLIKDPDIIRPNWVLEVKRNMPADEVSSAVKKAKDTPRYEPHSTARERLPIEY